MKPDVSRLANLLQAHGGITLDYAVVEGLLTGGNVANITMADALTAEIVGCYVVEDMGYDSDDHRNELRQQ